MISNALKYRNEQRQPRIHISVERAGAAWRFAVRDNGIGIEPQYKEKIFGVFKRLHRDRKYSGTGIGLAICQRVVDLYGGRIWVESEIGKGATFFFTIPERAARVPSPLPLILLLAEDNLPDALLVREAIKGEALPVEVHVVPDGERAIDFMAKAAEIPAAPSPSIRYCWI